MFRTMQVRYVQTERTVTPRREVELAPGIMVSLIGIRAFRRGGSGSPSDADTISSPAKFE